MKIHKNNLIISILSIILTLISIELLFTFVKGKGTKFSSPFQRYMLFEEGDVFQNIENYFKYSSNKNILAKTFYRINNKWVEEYSYEITTNNFGLVQNNNIKKNTPSILFLGDSYVEGQGASPWVNNFRGNYKDYQIINGGILGTGPQQFEMFENHCLIPTKNMSKSLPKRECEIPVRKIIQRGTKK